MCCIASNHPTFELGFLDDFEDVETVTEMVAETSGKSKDQIANLSEQDLEKILEDKQSNKTKKNTNWCVSTSVKGEFQT